jgi:hypothetical protein
MPLGFYTALDLLKLEEGIGHDLIEENIALSPEMSVIPADTIEGQSMTLSVRTDLPTIGFRNFNEGSARTKGAFENRTFNTHVLDHQCAVDKKLADARKPAARARMFAQHMSGVVEAAVRYASKQFYYGTGNDAKGFPGLIAQYAADADHEVNVTGSTAKSSVWFLRVGPNTLEFLFGNERVMGMEPEWKIETVYDVDSNPFQAFTNWFDGNVGLRLANKQSAVRIKNIGTASGKTLTYNHMHEALRKFTDLGWEPNVILMNGRSREQLRQELITPENKNPSVPKDFEGIPISLTSHLSNAEAA